MCFIDKLVTPMLVHISGWSRLMLTAQHCLQTQSDGSIAKMKFIPAYYDGNEPYGSAYSTNVYWDKKNS